MSTVHTVKKDATDSVLVLLVLCFGVDVLAVRAFYQFMCVFIYMSSVMFRLMSSHL